MEDTSNILGIIPTGQTIYCRHCHTSTTRPQDYLTDDFGNLFCCSGCKAVYSAIKSHHLDDFYELRNSFSNLIKPAPNTPKGAYEYLDLKEIQAEQIGQSNMTHYYIADIHCAACIWMLEKIPMIAQSIGRVRVNLLQKIAEVTVTSPAGLREFAELAAQLGYHSVPVKNHIETKELRNKDNRHSLTKVAVGAFCSGNIMLLSTGKYFGADHEFSMIFNYLNLLLTLPVLLYVGSSIWRGAKRSILSHTPSLDLPVAAAAWGGFILSVYNMYRGDLETYFDSIAILLTLVLASRYFSNLLQNRYLEIENQNAPLLPVYVTQFDFDTRQESIGSAQNLKVGDLLVVRQGQSIPTDGVIFEGHGLVNESLLTGESLPLPKNIQQPVFAGTTLEEGEIIIEATKIQSESRVSELQKNSLRLALSKGPHQLEIEKWTQKFTLLVIATASSVFIYFFLNHQIVEGFRRMLSILIVACPCSLALGMPLVYARSILKAADLGFTLKSGDVIRKIMEVHNVIFDKTGTLTYGRLTLVSGGNNLTSQQKFDVAQLESHVSHPVARCLVREWGKSIQPILEIKQFNSVPGVGVEGQIDGHFYQIKKSSESSEHLCVDVFIDGHKIDFLEFSDQIKSDAASTIRKLMAMGKKIFLLSGDHKSRVCAIAKQLSIHEGPTRYNCSPEDKENFLKGLKPTMMVGDGINDVGALARSHVGIIIGGALEKALQVGDVFMPQGKISPLTELINLASRAQQTLTRIRHFSLAYNIMAGSLALTGHIEPLLAAILMPISSVCIILICHLGVNLKAAERPMRLKAMEEFLT